MLAGSLAVVYVYGTEAFAVCGRACMWPAGPSAALLIARCRVVPISGRLRRRLDLIITVLAFNCFTYNHIRWQLHPVHAGIGWWG